MLSRANVVPLRKFVTSASRAGKYPQAADVVVVGGGVVSLSTAYHLVKNGCKNVVVLERSKITSGTSWHTSGLIWGLRPSDTDINLLNHTKYILTEELLQHEAVEDTGWINNGGLFLAHSQERLREYQRLGGVSKYFNIDSRMVDRADLNDILGGLLEGEKSGLLGGLYCPTDGHIDPSMYCSGLIKASAPHSRVYENSEVVGIITKKTGNINGGQDTKVTGVRVLDKSSNEVNEIKTDVVVAACGVWAPDVAKLAGIQHIPQIALQHAYVVTDIIPNNLVNTRKIPNIRDHDLSVYLRPSGSSLQVGGYEQNPKHLDNEPKFLSPFSLFELDWNVFGIHMELAMQLMPLLGNVGIKTTVCGPESFTPDHKPLLGEDSKVEGYFYASGFNSLGMNLSGGCGRELSKWVMNGKPDLDMFAYDVRRFNRNIIKNPSWVDSRCVEAYAENYSIVYPHEEALQGRIETFRDDLYDTLLNKNCFFEERQGFERPGYFLDQPMNYEDCLELDHSFNWDRTAKNWAAIEREALHCRNHVAVFNTSYMGKISITGQHASDAVNWLCTSDLWAKKNGTTTYTCMLNSSGGVEADVTVTKIDANNYYVNCAGFASNYVSAHVHCALKGKPWYSTVQIDDLTTSYGILSVQGPESRALLTEALELGNFLDLEKFPYLRHEVIALKQAPEVKLRIIRITYVGELGYELHVPMESLKIVYDLIMKPGKALDAGWRAIDCLSSEKGFRHWHADLRSDDSPYEAGIGFVVNSNKLDSELFHGAQQLRQRRIPKKKLICMTLNSEVLPWGLEPIIFNSQAIGYVRRASFAYSLNKPIAYGYVDSTLSDVSEVQVEIDGKLHNAVVHHVPPFDSGNMRIKGRYS